MFSLRQKSISFYSLVDELFIIICGQLQWHIFVKLASLTGGVDLQDAGLLS